MFLVKILAGIKNILCIPSGNTKNLLQKFIEEHSHLWSKETERKTTLTLKMFVDYMQHAQIDERLLVNFGNWMLNERKYAQNTANKKILIVKRYIEYLRRKGKIPRDMLFIDPKIKKHKKNRNKFASIREEDVIEKVITNQTLPLYFRILWATGIRISELCELKLSDISPCGKILTVRSSKTNKTYYPAVLFGLRDNLALLLKSTNKNTKLTTKKIATTRSDIVKLNKKLFGMEILPHDVRTIVINIMKRITKDDMLVQLQAGHSDITITQRNYFFDRDPAMLSKIDKISKRWAN